MKYFIVNRDNATGKIIEPTEVSYPKFRQYCFERQKESKGYFTTSFYRGNLGVYDSDERLVAYIERYYKV